ncbi:MAG: bifunctional riboflavin kinase/FAD synthetase [Alphaproteobacteria bacterium]|nr:bifunctional riboflavin kinase/FAD synthetase [Alphaproteobacteria bacterium]
MRLIRHASAAPAAAAGASVAIGNFDGVHLGHQAVVQAAQREASRLGAPSAVLTFTPHPRRFFRPDQPPFLLTRLRTKLSLVGALGVDLLYLLRFDAALASLTAEAFVDRVLIGAMRIRHAAVGYDFVFGKGRGGDPEFLRARLAAAGVATTVVAPVRGPGDIVFSSTAVRDALESGAPGRAAAILGRPFAIEGRVARGDRRGRLIGFPTANMWLAEYVRPRLGVYAVRARLDARNLLGVANLGLRPTFGGDKEPRLEVHLFDLDEDLYGRRLCVELIEFIRPEQRFDGLEALKAQIARDAAKARALLAGGCGTAGPSL